VEVHMEGNSGKFFCVLLLFLIDTVNCCQRDFGLSISYRTLYQSETHFTQWTSLKLMAFLHGYYHVLWNLFRNASNSEGQPRILWVSPVSCLFILELEILVPCSLMLDLHTTELVTGTNQSSAWRIRRIAFLLN